MPEEWNSKPGEFEETKGGKMGKKRGRDPQDDETSLE